MHEFHILYSHTEWNLFFRATGIDFILVGKGYLTKYHNNII